MEVDFSWMIGAPQGSSVDTALEELMLMVDYMFMEGMNIIPVLKGYIVTFIF